MQIMFTDKANFKAENCRIDKKVKVKRPPVVYKLPSSFLYGFVDILPRYPQFDSFASVYKCKLGKPSKKNVTTRLISIVSKL